MRLAGRPRRPQHGGGDRQPTVAVPRGRHARQLCLPGRRASVAPGGRRPPHVLGGALHDAEDHGGARRNFRRVQARQPPRALSGAECETGRTK